MYVVKELFTYKIIYHPSTVAVKNNDRNNNKWAVRTSVLFSIFSPFRSLVVAVLAFARQ